MPPPFWGDHLLLLVGNGATAATSRTRVLTTGTQVPVVTETTVDTHLLHALNVVTKLSLNTVGEHLRVLTSGDVLLPVKEPVGDLELSRGLEDVDNALKLIRVKLTSTVRSVSIMFMGWKRPAKCVTKKGRRAATLVKQMTNYHDVVQQPCAQCKHRTA